MLINRASLLVLLAAVLSLASQPLYEQVSWRGQVPPEFRQADEVRPGTPVVGSIERRGETLDFALRARPGRMYEVDLESDQFDPILRVHTITDRAVASTASDDDGGDGLNSRYVFCAPSGGGLYVLSVEALSGNGSGAYTLRVREVEGDVCRTAEGYRERLPADFVDGVREVRPGAPSPGMLVGGRAAWVLETEPAHLYRVDISASAFDPVLEVHRVENRVMQHEGSDDDGGDGTSPLYRFCSGGSAGLYLLVVRSYAGSGGGSVTASVTDEGAEACSDGGDPAVHLPPAHANDPVLRPGLAQSGTLPRGSTRSYVIATAPRRQYELVLTAETFDTFLRVQRAINGQLTEVGSNDDGGGGTNSRYAFCATFGAHVAEVSGFGGGGGGFYRLAVSELGGC